MSFWMGGWCVGGGLEERALAADWECQFLQVMLCIRVILGIWKNQDLLIVRLYKDFNIPLSLNSPAASWI